MSYRLENDTRKLTREQLLATLNTQPGTRFWVGGGDLSGFFNKAYKRRNGEDKVPEYMQPIEPVERVVFRRSAAQTERTNRSRRNHTRGTRGKKR